MRKRVIIVSVTIVVVVLFSYIFTLSNPTHKPDDKLSKAVCESLGDELYYMGRSSNTNNNIDRVYYYLIKENDPDLVYNMVNVVDDVLRNDESRERIWISCGTEFGGNGVAVCFFLTNYYDGVEGGYSKELCGLIIKDNLDGSDNGYYNNIDLYLNIPDIEYLEISERMQKKLIDGNINLYDYWPKLKEVKVIE